MVIDPGNNLNSPSTTSSGAAKTRPAVQGRAPAQLENERTPAQSQDSVSLSQQGQALARLSSELSSAPDVDQDKVAAIRNALANGSYQIDGQAIASKMLEQDDLLG